MLKFINLDIHTNIESDQKRLYPDLTLHSNQRGMQSKSGPSVRRTLYGPQIGDTTNPHAELPDPQLLEDKHFVANVAMQQNGVPTGQQVGTLQPCCQNR